VTLTRSHATTVSSPWTRTDALLTAAVIAVGCLVWAIGWYRVSGEGAFDSQIVPLNVAVFGVLVGGAGQVLWFLGGRRAVDHRRRVLLGDDAIVTAHQAPVVDGDSFVGGEHLYHRADCPMAADRPWAPLSRVEQEQAGRVPCGWCEP
jgi:hypothetical protein